MYDDCHQAGDCFTILSEVCVYIFTSRTFQRQIDTIIVFYTVFLLLVIVFLFLGAFIRSHQHTHFFCKVTVIFSAFHPFENVCKKWEKCNEIIKNTEMNWKSQLCAWKCVISDESWNLCSQFHLLLLLLLLLLLWTINWNKLNHSQHFIYYNICLVCKWTVWTLIQNPFCRHTRFQDARIVVVEVDLEKKMYFKILLLL